MQVVLLTLLVVSASAAGSKPKKTDKFLSAYPMLFKFLLFWWCVVVFVIMAGFIADNLCWRYIGSAPVKWSTSYTFDGRASREAYWAQFVDPSAWTPTHPILQSADVRMVKVLSPEDAAVEQSSNGAAPGGLDVSKEYSLADPPPPDAVAEAKLMRDEIQAANGIRSEPSKRMKPTDFGPLKVGLGLVLRHKVSEEQRSGLFFCSRECTLLEVPEEGPWEFEMQTAEVGVGHVFLPGTEEVRIKLWPAEDDGTIKCDMEGSGAVQSRLFRWWYALDRSSAESAQAMLESFNEQQGQAKKAD